MRFDSVAVATVAITVAVQAGIAQELPFDSLLRAHSHELTIQAGRLEGPGHDLLLEGARGAQFFTIAEEHNLRELNQLTTLLFSELHDQFGFRYLALETGSVIASWLGDDSRRGDLAAIAALVGRYPVAPTFATDEELELIAAVGAISSAATNPIWGVDQEFGALHILERLAQLAPSEEAQARCEALAEQARPYDEDRTHDTHYVSQVATPAAYSDLEALFQPTPGSETDLLIQALQRTLRIYHNYFLSTQGQPTAYENGREREESMKLRFMESYNRARVAGDSLPRVLAKLGHWHTLRGFARSNVLTLGNFLSEFAIANGMRDFIVSTYVVESPEAWRNTRGPLAAAAGEGQFTVVDLRPLRPYAHQGKIADLSDGYRRLIFRADAALIVRGGQTGSYDIARGGGGS
jgi:hypothetical protein